MSVTTNEHNFSFSQKGAHCSFWKIPTTFQNSFMLIPFLSEYGLWSWSLVIFIFQFFNGETCFDFEKVAQLFSLLPYGGVIDWEKAPSVPLRPFWFSLMAKPICKLKKKRWISLKKCRFCKWILSWLCFSRLDDPLHGRRRVVFLEMGRKSSAKSK